MPFEIVETTVLATVTGEDELDNVNNPASGQFLPDSARLNARDGKLVVMVSGPMLKLGMPMKSKRGLTSFDLKDVEAGTAPQWVTDLIKQVQA